MNSLYDMLWVETHKAIRSRMPLWTGIGSLFMPLGIAFLIFIARNPQVSQKLGLVGAKANLMAYAATDWAAYLGLSAQMVAAGGFFFFVLAVSWVFGREFADGTLKDLLAVPVPRSTILLAKFLVAAVWCAGVALLMIVLNLGLGALIRLPGGSYEMILGGSGALAVTAVLTIAVTLPFAFFASTGRGYLLPIGMAVLTLMLTNLVVVAGWGAYFPWAIAALYSQADGQMVPASGWIVLFTLLAGMLATYAWWKLADQNW